jgi:hypothetical protein
VTAALDFHRSSDAGASGGRLVTPPFSGEHKRADLHGVEDRANSHVAVHRHTSERCASLLISGRYRITIPDRKRDVIVQPRACSSSDPEGRRGPTLVPAFPAEQQRGH